MSGLFGDGFKDAKIGGRGAYFTDGLYRVEIETVKKVVTRKEQKYYTAECKILIAKNSALAPGMIRSWMVGTHQDNFYSDVKGFIAAIYGYDPSNTDNQKIIDENVTPEFAEKTYEVQPTNLKGKIVDLEAFTRPNKNKEGQFTVHNWRPFWMNVFQLVPVG
jgi:hypothetical protein